MWAMMFQTANLWALVAWAVLILAPRSSLVLSAVFYLGAGGLCLAYALGLALVLGGAGDAGPAVDFTSMAGVRAIFASDAGVAIGWTHYLALDLFTGLWIARDADAKAFPRLWQAPVLVLTFLAGPAGLLLWFACREPAARRAAREAGKRAGG